MALVGSAVRTAYSGKEHGLQTRGTRAWGSEERRMCVVAFMVIALGTTFQSVAWAAPVGGSQQEDTPLDQREAGPTKSDKELGEKLIRQAHSDADVDVMDAILRLMGSAAQRLEIELDAGEETQALQRQVMGQLNDAIKIAGQRRRTRSRDQEPARGDRRRQREEERQRSDKRARSNQERPDPSSETTDVGAGRREGDRDGGKLYESRRTWGQLPLREREEVIQGISERYLERFRTWIEQYYRALQESEDSNTR
ncbi:MAG: hypothetical protein ACYTFA_16815 [Planctomycetota bacterium]|jgi:hypothetical protein